jgi:hypothetical protein
MWTIIGVALCIAIFIYLSYVARKAVDEELDDETADDEETLNFLPSRRGDSESRAGSVSLPMGESPFLTHTVPSLRLDGS